MSKRTVRSGAQLVSILGVLLVIAPSFDILRDNIGYFWGIAAFVVSGTLWGLSGRFES